MKTLGRQMLCYLLLCFAVTTYAEETISIDTDNTSLIYKVDKDKKLRQVYFGSFLMRKRPRQHRLRKPMLILPSEPLMSMKRLYVRCMVTEILLPNSISRVWSKIN